MRLSATIFASRPPTPAAAKSDAAKSVKELALITGTEAPQIQRVQVASNCVRFNIIKCACAGKAQTQLPSVSNGWQGQSERLSFPGSAWERTAVQALPDVELSAQRVTQ